MKVLFSARARADVEAVADFIAINNPARAETFAAELVRACIAIGDRPRAYPAKENLHPELRIRYYKKHAIIYRLTDRQILIVRVAHAARELSALLDDELD